MPKSSGRRRRGTSTDTTNTRRQGHEDDDDASKSLAVGDFVDVTNAEPEVARHVLEAHGWNVDEAVSFYLETGGVGYQQTVPQAENHMAVEGRRNGTRQSRGASHPIMIDEEDEEVVDLEDEEESEDSDDDDDDWGEEEEDEEENLRTLASLRSRRRAAANVQYQEDTDDDDDDDDDAIDMDDDAYGDEEERFKYGRRSRRGHRRSLRRGQQPSSQPVGTMDTQVPDDILRMPDVNVEEQKMLLAALTGQAYEGEVPTHFTTSSARPLSPGAIERRMVREEQDLALKESLERDKEKQRQQEVEKIQEMEREESERLAKEAQERQLHETLETKKMRLPEEPQEDQEGCFVLVIRMPNGSRLKRRFSKKDRVQSAFDFVDVQCGGATDVLPGTYNLVSQFPRKVYGHTHQGTFEDSDFTHKQEALFVERVH